MLGFGFWCAHPLLHSAVTVASVAQRFQLSQPHLPTLDAAARRTAYLVSPHFSSHQRPTTNDEHRCRTVATPLHLVSKPSCFSSGHFSPAHRRRCALQSLPSFAYIRHRPPPHLLAPLWIPLIHLTRASCCHASACLTPKVAFVRSLRCCALLTACYWKKRAATCLPFSLAFDSKASSTPIGVP